MEESPRGDANQSLRHECVSVCVCGFVCVCVIQDYRTALDVFARRFLSG